MHDFGERDAPFRTKLQVLFSANGRRAVVLRRGPKLHNRLLVWDLPSDELVTGQWMKGTVELWDLDPQGEKLLYWARQWHRTAPRREEHEAVPGAGEDGPDEANWEPRHQPALVRRGRRVPRYMRSSEQTPARPMRRRPRRNEGLWTAVSRPPYFTALAIWPCFGHWTGGGVFEGANTIRLQESADGLVPKVNAKLPKDLTIRRFSELGRVPDVKWCADRGVEPGKRARFGAMEAMLAAAGVRWIEFFHEAGKDLLFGADGQLFRLRHWLKVPEYQRVDASVRVADLRGMTFDLVPPPEEALLWPRGARGKPSKVPRPTAR